MRTIDKLWIFFLGYSILAAVSAVIEKGNIISYSALLCIAALFASFSVAIFAISLYRQKEG